MVVIPLLSLVFLNWRIYRAIKTRERFRANLKQKNASRDVQSPNNEENSERAKRKKERELTISKILVTIVVMFFICQSFKVSGVA
jgi:HAMP domain-containing protein